MTIPDKAIESLRGWFATQITDAVDVSLHNLDRIDLGHSAELLTLTLAWTYGCSPQRRDVVLRLRPREPGLLEPYDVRRQFDVLRALRSTAVLAPPALWLEPTGQVLDRPFFVMERVEGNVYEREVPSHLAEQPESISRMCRRMIDQVADIHCVDLDSTGLARLADGHGFLDRELERWRREAQRVARGPLPGLERLHAELRARQPEPSPTVTLVHGDMKPGNVAFVGDDVRAIFDWEMVDVEIP